MKKIALIFFSLFSIISFSQDTTFWEYAKDFEINQSGSIHRDWGSETVTYLGTVSWKSPSGKTLQIRIITSYQKITQANGFNDRSLLALVKVNHGLIKTYDMVKRQNLPLKAHDDVLIYSVNGLEVASELPPKFGERFCVDGLTCFSEIDL